ncbi:hypothetical protein LRS65_26900 (plasmid) [Bacillus cereus]|nr:hypothetical protein [Bacillus cereus]UUN20241.1 hypothetical protein LRS65_26900 [Bacillus cereus]
MIQGEGFIICDKENTNLPVLAQNEYLPVLYEPKKIKKSWFKRKEIYSLKQFLQVKKTKWLYIGLFLMRMYLIIQSVYGGRSIRCMKCTKVWEVV